MSSSDLTGLEFTSFNPNNQNKKSKLDSALSFAKFNLNPLLLEALETIGYEKPSPIQAEIIPILCQGKDVIGQAQTGTGKTAAFALPLLDKLNLDFSDEDGRRLPQALVLAPTRELAIQVADSFRQYSSKLKGIVIATLCGGQDYRSQLKDLKNGAHVVVGTPGRVIDHINRGTLDISKVETLVLDEADEMLRMGFIDDVDWILSHTPQDKQIALFSATMPFAIKSIADRYLHDPEYVTIKPKTETTNLISQYYWGVSYQDKIDTLMRILEISKYDDMDAMIVFARTKVETMAIGEKLLAHGYRAIVLNGDIEQKMRERSINEIKSGRTDILIATDVAARGLDIDRITHVINYDMPHDQETYLHRIGRTGRAGRKGTAITFVTRSENFKLSQIERFTKISIEKYKMPTVAEINKQRVKLFKARVLEILALSRSEDANNSAKKKQFQDMINIISQIGENTEFNGFDIAAAVSMMLHSNAPLLLKEDDTVAGGFTSPSRNKERSRSHSNFNSSSNSKQSRGSRSRFSEDTAGREKRDNQTGFKSKFKPKVSVNTHHADSSSRDTRNCRDERGSRDARSSRDHTRGRNDFSFEKAGDYTNRRSPKSGASTKSGSARPSFFNKDAGSFDNTSRSTRNKRDGISSAHSSNPGNSGSRARKSSYSNGTQRTAQRSSDRSATTFNRFNNSKDTGRGKRRDR